MITRKDQLCLSNEKKGGKQTKSAEADDEAPRPKRKPAFKPRMIGRRRMLGRRT